jgi:DNA-binding NarL/FixJ family response regulator
MRQADNGHDPFFCIACRTGGSGGFATGALVIDWCKAESRLEILYRLCSLETTMPIRLVLADAHPLILIGLQHLFDQDDDFQVVACCRDGTELLQTVRQHRPDVLILDPRLPGKDGWGVLQELAQDSFPIRIVLLTSEVDADEALKAVHLGVSGVVLKEMAEHLLVQCVRKVHAGDHWVERRSISRALDKLLQREAGQRKLEKILTPREREIVHLVACGLRNREVAEKLTISEGTVKIHLHHIYEKLQMHSRLALMQYAYAQGLF